LAEGSGQVSCSLNSSPSSPPGPLSQTDEWVTVAKIVRPRGLRGEVIAELFTDFPERFAERKRLFLLRPNFAPQPIELERFWLHQGRIVLKFAGIDSVEAAETLRNLEVAIPKTERASLKDGSVYIDDLIGSTLIDSRSGENVGEITEVDRESSATPLLVIQTIAKQETLVPFVKAFHPRFDATAKQLTMELPEGLLEVNAPGESRQQ
jgi:16S rRNA processing protein RimM